MAKVQVDAAEELKEQLAAGFAAIREKTGLSMQAFAQELGYKQASSIQRYADPAAHSGKYLRAEIIDRMLGALPDRYSVTRAEILALGGPVRVAEDGERQPEEETPVASGIKPNASPPVPIDFPGTRLPIYGHAVGGEDGRFVLNGQQVADVLCPPQLYGVPNAYGVFVQGDSMEPRYEAGEVVFVNPNIGVRKGHYVVVQIRGEREGDDAAGFVKRFVSMNSKELVLEQIKPREDIDEDAPEAERFTMRFPRSRVAAVHKIVGTASA